MNNGLDYTPRSEGGIRLKKKENRNRRASDTESSPTEESGLEKLGGALGVPASVFGGGPAISLSGNREALVEGCQGVLEYDENVVKLAAGKLAVRFSGRNLQIKVLTHDSALVEGFFTSIDFIA